MNLFKREYISIAIRPSLFKRYGELNINGDYQKPNIKDFILATTEQELAEAKGLTEEQKETLGQLGVVQEEISNVYTEQEAKKLNDELNYLFFLVECIRNPEGEVELIGPAELAFSGEKFEVEQRIDQEINEKVISLSSNKIGIFMEMPISLSAVTLNPSKISGKIKTIRENEGLSRKYVESLKSEMDVAEHYYEEYKKTCNGLTKSTMNLLRRKSRKY